MKVLLANAACNMGGVETLMITMASILRSRGHECELFFFSHGPMEKYLPAGCVAHFGDLADLLQLVVSRGFDVVHANSTDWHVGISAVRGTGVALVLTSHGRTEPNWTKANCDALASCCAWEADEQQPYTDIEIRKVPNGVDTERFKPGGERPRAATSPIIAWVGRGTDPMQKRLDRFAAIAPALSGAGLRLHLVEPYGPEAVDEVTPGLSESLLPYVEFWGAVPVGEMPDFFRKVAASGGYVVSTSSFEGLPLTLLEAQACGCPVVGPDVRGVNECVTPSRGGVLYPSDLPSGELAELVLGCVRDAEGTRRRGAACALHVREKFSIERMAQDYLRIYEEALLAGGRRPAGSGRRLRALGVGWKEYVERNWSAGHFQFEASLKLAARGEAGLASVAARAALVTCPTLYLRPSRMAHLLKTGVRAKKRPPDKLQGASGKAEASRAETTETVAKASEINSARGGEAG